MLSLEAAWLGIKCMGSGPIDLDLNSLALIPTTCCVTLYNLLNLSVPRSSYLGLQCYLM